MIPKVVSVKTNDDYSIEITFSDGKVKVYDCKHLINKGQFSILNDISKFHKVIIDDLGGIGWDIDENVDSDVVWNNRIDICKDVLYSDSVEVASYIDDVVDQMFNQYDKVFKKLAE